MMTDLIMPECLASSVSTERLAQDELILCDVEQHSNHIVLSCALESLSANADLDRKASTRKLPWHVSILQTFWLLEFWRTTCSSKMGCLYEWHQFSELCHLFEEEIELLDFPVALPATCSLAHWPGRRPGAKGCAFAVCQLGCK